MKKKEFLEKLRRRLVVLHEDEIDDIIGEYEQFIAEKKKKGKTEAAAIKEFGDFDELVKEILSAYKVKDDNNYAKNMVMNFFNDAAKIFERIANYLSSRDFNQIMRFVFEIFLLIVIISIFKWPVELLIRLGRDIFSILPAPFFQLFSGLWRFILEIGYLILAIVFFIKIFKERFLKNMPERVADKKTKKKIEKEIKNIEDEIEDEVLSELKKDEKVAVKKSGKEDDDSFEALGNVFTIILKIFAFFILVPTLFTTLGLMIAFGLGVGLFISGVHYIGVLLSLFAMVCLAGAFAELLFRFIFSLRIKGTRVLISFLSGIVLLGAGISIATFEIANTRFINSVPSDFEDKLTMTEEYFMASDINLISRWHDVEFIVDESIDDKVRVVVNHYLEFTNLRIELDEISGVLGFSYNREILFPERRIYNSIIRNLRNKEIYNYVLLRDIDIRVYASKETIEKIKESHQTYIRNQEMQDIMNDRDRIIQERNDWEQKYWDLFNKSN